MGNNPRLVRKSKGARAALSSEISSEDHQRVLELGRDVPDEVPAFQIPLSEVGISGKTLWISLPEGRLPFDAEVCVDLPGQARGIHMSRIEEAISQLYYKPFPDIRAYAQAPTDPLDTAWYGLQDVITTKANLAKARDAK